MSDGRRVAPADVLKGLVMVLMALDHTRDFFTDVRISPTDLEQTSVALFLTRWVTHLCAPTFLFLAGAAVCFSMTRGTERAVLMRRLVLRGLWLVILELTVIHFAWDFRGEFSQIGLGVLWAIGWSMVLLALMLPLPSWVALCTGVAIIGSHNLFDGLKAAGVGAVGPLWAVLHSGEPVKLGWGIVLHPYYRVGPWFGVMALGYGFGFILRRESRRRWCIGLGMSMLLLFGVLRYLNGYGDPQPWSVQARPIFTALAFLNCTKYPPSLLYLLMTLGLALVLIGLLESVRHRITETLAVYGRVPLFFYIAHLYFIHALALSLVWARGGDVQALVASPFAGDGYPAGYGYSLPGVYGMWLVVIAALYPLCRWLSAAKLRRRAWWSTYL